VSQVLLTAQRKRSGAAPRERLPHVSHHEHRDLNTRTAHSPQPLRQRERQMSGYQSQGTRQAASPRMA
jgi:transposase-like protein